MCPHPAGLTVPSWERLFGGTIGERWPALLGPRHVDAMLRNPPTMNLRHTSSAEANMQSLIFALRQVVLLVIADD